MSELAENLRLEFRDVLRSNPDRPEIQPERRVDDVEQDRRGQHETSDPVPRHPLELNTDDGEKCREEQDEHRRRHHPVEQAGDERMFLNLVGQLLVLRFERLGLRRGALAMRREEHVAGVRDEEQDARKQRAPEQAPRNVRENPFTPRIASPP